jgi:biotin transport system substrate-specific component
MILGNLVIYVCGVPWLMFVQGVGLHDGITMGVLPFLLGDAIKIAVAAAVLPAAWLVVRRVRKD